MTNQETRQGLFDTMVINQNIINEKGLVLINHIPTRVEAKTNLMFSNQARYAAIAQRFANPGLKWWLIAVIHEMECTQNFNTHLHNGDPLTHKTVHVPAGRPLSGEAPFSFEDSATDALKLQGADKITDWSMGNVLYFLEGYNGYGYSQYHNINSPYLWSGSNHYTTGKYVADGDFDSNAVSQQIGIALLLKSVLQK